MYLHSSRENPKMSVRWRASLAAALTVLLGLATTGASATAIASVTRAVALPAPFSHSIFINNDAGNRDHRMSLPTSSTSVRFLLPSEVSALDISRVEYSLYGENFTVGGAVSLDAQKRSVTIPLPAGFFSVTPGHRPLIGPSDENGVPVHAAGYYGFEFTATGPTAQPPRLGLGSGDLLSVTAVVERGTDTGERTPVFSLHRDDVDSVNTRTQYFSAPTQSVRKGDRVTVTGPRGFWTGTPRPFVSRQVALGSDLNEDSLENLLLPQAVSADGSRITVTVRDRSASDSDIDVQPGAAPLIAITMLTGIPFGPGGADAVDVYVPVRTAPGAPTMGTPTAGQASATVRWTAPTDGGAAILGYRVRAYAGGKLVTTRLVVGRVQSAVVTGLRNGTAYTFDVAAANRIGIGPVWKRSTTVTPRG
ncbi:Fibronectin type III domain-containing protein [Cryobacterium luteum]|uniref:Fibronectin type III domain-containing protein n=2 Tax=Cryobacterium luteum TaxID=1424661 RepID=A0A1H8JEX9_9MICO|nr:fibronectin type III domain-containing protein [Cryobacterium luteum]SEN79262.1 Fibronectin type III domain-containing protein [Cryobacterium luteum]